MSACMYSAKYTCDCVHEHKQEFIIWTLGTSVFACTWVSVCVTHENECAVSMSDFHWTLNTAMPTLWGCIKFAVIKELC